MHLKGLDLAVEAFAANPKLLLHSWATFDEREFLDSYRHELASPNILQHGYLDPSGSEFREIVDRCFAFVAPSASEESRPQQPAACSSALPDRKQEHGYHAAEGAGTYLETCSIPEIEAAASSLREMTSDDVRESIALTQTEAKRRYSRRAFSERMSRYLDIRIGRVG